MSIIRLKLFCFQQQQFKIELIFPSLFTFITIYSDSQRILNDDDDDICKSYYFIGKTIIPQDAYQALS